MTKNQMQDLLVIATHGLRLYRGNSKYYKQPGNHRLARIKDFELAIAALEAAIKENAE